MRIGNVYDSKPPREQDAFEKDPERSAVLKINSAKPFNAEPPRALIADNFITPSDLFFVRNHLPVPVVTKSMEANYQLEGMIDKGELLVTPQHSTPPISSLNYCG